MVLEPAHRLCANYTYADQVYYFKYPEIFLVTHHDYIYLQLCKMCFCSNVLCIVFTVSNPSDEHSLRIVLDSISTLTADWFNLGVALGLSHNTLKTIESNHPRDAHRCFTEMVIAWLMQGYSQPSWQSLVSALSSPLVNRIEIAAMIAAEHPAH